LIGLQFAWHTQNVKLLKYIELNPVVFLLAVSSLQSFPDYPARPAKECPVSSQKLGVTIGLEPVESSEAQQTYFHSDLAKKGFVPVLVVIENGRAADSLIFDKAKVTYGPADSAPSIPPAAPGAAKMIAVAAIPVLGVLASAQMISDISEVRQNLLRKEIRSTTLSPGTPTRGFLYLAIPKKTPRGKIALRVPIAKAGTDETFEINLVF
jgi:hypothetical protein